MTYKDSGRRGPAKKQRLTLFDGRTKKSQGIDWRGLDDLEMRSALAVAMSRAVTISFTPAAGGAGILVKVYQGDYAASEFADSIEAVNELLSLITDTYQSPSEDVRLALQRGNQDQSLAAD